MSGNSIDAHESYSKTEITPCVSDSVPIKFKIILRPKIKLAQCPLWALRSFSILFFACAASTPGSKAEPLAERPTGMWVSLVLRSTYLANGFTPANSHNIGEWAIIWPRHFALAINP